MQHLSVRTHFAFFRTATRGGRYFSQEALASTVLALCAQNHARMGRASPPSTERSSCSHLAVGMKCVLLFPSAHESVLLLLALRLKPEGFLLSHASEFYSGS